MGKLVEQRKFNVAQRKKTICYYKDMVLITSSTLKSPCLVEGRYRKQVLCVTTTRLKTRAFALPVNRTNTRVVSKHLEIK